MSTYAGVSGFQYDPIGRPKSVPVSFTLTLGWRGDGLRGWKQNGSNPKLYYLYDGELPICELDPTGAVVNSYGYGPLGLVQRFYNQNSSVSYILYTFDPFGNLVERIRRFDSVPADTAVYETAIGNSTTTHAPPSGRLL